MRRIHRSTRFVRLVGVVVLLTSCGVVATQSSSASPVPPRFDFPESIAVNARHLWVNNLESNSISELNVLDGSLVRVINAKSDHVSRPEYVFYHRSRVWVLSASPPSISELNASNGALVHVFALDTDQYGLPDDIVFGAVDDWVLEGGPQSAVVEIDPRNDSIVRTVKAKVDGLYNATAMTLSATHLWITDTYSSAVTELNASNGSLVRVVTSQHDDLDYPDGIVASGGDVWVANQGANSVSEFDGASGAFLRVVHAGGGLQVPDDLSLSGAHLWVTGAGGTVAELNATNGALVQVVNLSVAHIYSNGPVAVNGSRLWVPYEGANVIAEFDATSGSLVRVIK